MYQLYPTILCPAVVLCFLRWGMCLKKTLCMDWCIYTNVQDVAAITPAHHQGAGGMRHRTPKSMMSRVGKNEEKEMGATSR